MKEARQLVKGTFKHADDDDEPTTFVPANLQDNDKVNLNRAMCTGTNDPKHEIALDNFDDAIANALLEQEMMTKHGDKDPRNFKDNVPNNLRETFNLPKDMRNYEIDFEEVRSTDVRFKRRTPEWSG